MFVTEVLILSLLIMSRGVFSWTYIEERSYIDLGIAGEMDIMRRFFPLNRCMVNEILSANGYVKVLDVSSKNIIVINKYFDSSCTNFAKELVNVTKGVQVDSAFDLGIEGFSFLAVWTSGVSLPEGTHEDNSVKIDYRFEDDENCDGPVQTAFVSNGQCAEFGTYGIDGFGGKGYLECTEDDLWLAQAEPGSSNCNDIVYLHWFYIGLFANPVLKLLIGEFCLPLGGFSLKLSCIANDQIPEAFSDYLYFWDTVYNTAEDSACVGKAYSTNHGLLDQCDDGTVTSITKNDYLEFRYDNAECDGNHLVAFWGDMKKAKLSNDDCYDTWIDFEQGFYHKFRFFNNEQCMLGELRDSLICNQRGTCYNDTIPLFECDCNEGYTGVQCEYAICDGIPQSDDRSCGSGFCLKPDFCVGCPEGFLPEDFCYFHKDLGLIIGLSTGISAGMFLCISCVVLVVACCLVSRIQEKKKKSKILEEKRKREEEIEIDLKDVILELDKEIYIGLFDFVPSSPDELSFLKEDKITLISKDEQNWWKGELNGKTGLFPVTYVQKYSPFDYCKALYSFTAENKDELSFNEGDKIMFLEKREKNYWKGEINGEIGLFPVVYVKLCKRKQRRKTIKTNSKTPTPF